MAKEIIKKGIFITLEGPEGSGKSTQCKLLCSYLNRRRRKVLCAREPGGTAIGEKIRGILLDKKNSDMASEAELFLYLSARAQIVKEIIKPALKRGFVVVCDRFSDATLAYQGYGAGIDAALIKKLNRIATAGLAPHLTILLDIPTKEGLRRSRGKDRMEEKSVEFHKRVREGYLKMARREPNRIKVVKIKGGIADVQEKIRRIVADVI